MNSKNKTKIFFKNAKIIYKEFFLIRRVTYIESHIGRMKSRNSANDYRHFHNTEYKITMFKIACL